MHYMVATIIQQGNVMVLQAQTRAQRDEQRQQKEEALSTARGVAEFRRHNPSRFEGDHDPDKADL